MRLLLILSLLSPAIAHAESWIVFPVFAEHPPPRDPTLLRMSVDLAKVISESVSGKVRLAKREEREDSCPLECPKEIASMLSTDHVITMHLADGYDQLALIIFEPARSPDVRKIACSYENGSVSCDAKQLSETLKDKKQDQPIDEKVIQAAFSGLTPQLVACGEQKANVEASVRFRVRPDGRVTDVRIDPPNMQNRKPYDCMARVVESLRVPPFDADTPVAFLLPLPASEARSEQSERRPLKGK